MPTIDATVFTAEAYVLVEADWSGTLLRDTFTRTVSNGWGTPDEGPIWNDVGGVAANRSVNGLRGVHTHTATNVRVRQISNVAADDIDMTGRFINTTVPAGGDFELEVLARWIDGNNFVGARLFLLLSGGVSCAVRQVVGGIETTSAFPTIPGLTNIDDISWRFVADGATIFFKAWRTGTPEPLTWNISLAVTWLTAGGAGVGSLLAPTVSNPLPLSLFFDDFVFVDPDHVDPLYAKVTRRNTVTGEIVTLRPYIAYDDEGNLLLECGLGLWWDTEPPLNVPLEYCTTAAGVQVNVAQNCCFEAATVNPWTVTGGTFVTSSTFSHEGLLSGLLTPNGTTTTPFVQQTVSGLVEGEPITMSAWILTPQGWNAVWLQLVVTYTDASTETFMSPVEILDDGEWRFLQHTFTPSKEISSAVFSLRVGGIPPGTTLFYIDEIQLTQEQAVGGEACETVTVSSESLWLKSPLNPCSDVEIGICSPMLQDCEDDTRVSYVGHDSEDYAPNTVLWQPVNQRYPIPVNRVRRGATSTLRLLAHDCDARDALRLANEPGDPLLFQAPADYCIEDRYISVGMVNESRLSVDQREDFRLVTLPYAVVSRPVGPANGVCGARIDDLCDIYTSWAAMNIAGLTWTDLLLGEASPDGPGQPDPPAAARTWDEVNAEFANWTAVDSGGTRDWDELEDGL